MAYDYKKQNDWLSHRNLVAGAALLYLAGVAWACGWPDVLDARAAIALLKVLSPPVIVLVASALYDWWG